MQQVQLGQTACEQFAVETVNPVWAIASVVRALRICAQVLLLAIERPSAELLLSVRNTTLVQEKHPAGKRSVWKIGGSVSGECS